MEEFQTLLTINMIIETPVQAINVEMSCDKCPDGRMVSTGHGITRWHTNWEHKCNRCGHVEWYENVHYPTIIHKPIQQQ